LIDDRGRVQVPGFYDDVAPLTDAERQQFAALPFNEDRFKQQIGVQELAGEEGYTTLERRWARPTYDVLAIWGGERTPKSAIQASATARASFRLVPRQDPQKIAASLKSFLLDRSPPGIELDLHVGHGSPGVVVPLDSPYVAAASRAIEKGFGARPVFIREGGSIPIVNTFADVLKADVLLLGWGQNDDNPHSPNEKFSLEDYHRGIRASAALWNQLAKVSDKT
jgi:acetylornithine deacetylase/succinyl-diaminopimelate desuccinylase-like protein